VIAWFGAIPGVGDIVVAAREDFVHQQVDFGGIELAAGDATHVIYDVAGHGIDLIVVLKVGCGKPAGSLPADVQAVMAGYFLGKGMGRLSGMVTVSARTVDLPVQAGCIGFVLQDAFSQRTAADIAQANHQDLHIEYKGKEDAGMVGKDERKSRGRMWWKEG